MMNANEQSKMLLFAWTLRHRYAMAKLSERTARFPAF